MSQGVAEVPPRAAQRPDRAHNCRSIEPRRSSRADIPLPDPLGCTGWEAVYPVSGDAVRKPTFVVLRGDEARGQTFPRTQASAIAFSRPSLTALMNAR